MSSSSLMRGTGSPLAHAANNQCLSPQDKLKGASSVKASTSLGLVNQQRKKPTDLVDVAAMEIDLDLDLTQDDQDEDMDDAGWISDDNLRALDFDDRLNQDIDWVGPDKLQLFPSASDDDEDDDVVQDFVFDPSSFLSPLRGSLSFDGVASSSFAESLSVDTPPPSFGTSHDAEKLLMSFDTMNFTIPSPTSGSTKKRTSLFGKNDPSTATATDASSAAADSKSSSANEKDGARSPLPKLSIPSPEHLLGVLSITTPTAGGHHTSTVDSQKKIGSYSPEARRLRIQKFHEKRKNRTWKKSIKYDCRKKLADDRPRIKGRFVRVLENATDVKEEDTCSTTSTSSTGVSSPRSLGSPLPSALFGAALTISTGEATPVPSPSASPAQPSVIASPSPQPTVPTGVPLAVAVAAVATAQMPIKIEQPAAAP